MANDALPSPTSVDDGPAASTRRRRPWRPAVVRLAVVGVAVLVLRALAPEVLAAATSGPGVAARVGAVTLALVGWSWLVRRAIPGRVVGAALAIAPAAAVLTWSIGPYLRDDVVDEAFPVAAGAPAGDEGVASAQDGPPVRRTTRSAAAADREPQGASEGAVGAEPDDGEGEGDPAATTAPPGPGAGAGPGATAEGGAAGGGEQVAGAAAPAAPTTEGTASDAPRSDAPPQAVRPAGPTRPAAVEPEPEPASAVEGPAAGPVAVAAGDFEGLTGHRGEGRATVYELPDGARVLRFEGFEVSNGPELEVHLVPGADRRSPDRGTRIAGLKGNVGDQNYDVPPGIDLSGPYTVLIWCVPFAVEVANASLG